MCCSLYIVGSLYLQHLPSKWNLPEDFYTSKYSSSFRLFLMLWGFPVLTCLALCSNCQDLRIHRESNNPIYGCYSHRWTLYPLDNVVRNPGCGGNVRVVFFVSPSEELCRFISRTLSWLSSPSAHNTSPWGVLWGGSAPESWQAARVHHHTRSAASLPLLN